MLVTERQCRACASPLDSVLNLGNMALSSFPLEHTPTNLPSAPLDLCRCTTCGLVQLRHTVSPDTMFREYWYQSGVNETMRAELRQVVASAVNRFGQLPQGSVVVDVGANDGTLLSAYTGLCLHGCDIKRVAFEPATNLKAKLRRHCNEVHDYFPSPALPSHSVTILTSIACFYAVDDPVAFVRAVDDALTDDGIWVVQFQDLHQMLEATAFDDICHEHLFYPSLASVERLLAPFDLKIIDAEHRRINGGSLRLTISRRWQRVLPRVDKLSEIEAGCEDLATLTAFAQRVCDIRAEICWLLKSRMDKVIDVYGASTKGNTLLQLCRLGPSDIRQAWERSPEKWGRHTITGIPIVSEEVGRSKPPDLLFVLIWQFRDAIIARERDYLKAGGKLLFPLPRVELV